MNAPAFTPGPWKRDAGDPRYIRSVKTKEYIAARQSSNPADSALLAVAPELYTAAAAVAALYADEPEDELDPAWVDLRAALAKAVQP